MRRWCRSALGVHIQEVPAACTITGVSTSIGASSGRASKPDRPGGELFRASDFIRSFGAVARVTSRRRSSCSSTTAAPTATSFGSPTAPIRRIVTLENLGRPHRPTETGQRRQGGTFGNTIRLQCRLPAPPIPDEAFQSRGDPGGRRGCRTDREASPVWAMDPDLPTLRPDFRDRQLGADRLELHTNTAPAPGGADDLTLCR